MHSCSQVGARWLSGIAFVLHFHKFLITKTSWKTLLVSPIVAGSFFLSPQMHKVLPQQQNGTLDAVSGEGRGGFCPPARSAGFHEKADPKMCEISRNINMLTTYFFMLPNEPVANRISPQYMQTNWQVLDGWNHRGDPLEKVGAVTLTNDSEARTGGGV